MSIPERIGCITAGRVTDFGASPSKEQREVIGRTEDQLQEADTKKRRDIRQRYREEQQAAREQGGPTPTKPSPSRKPVCRNTRPAGRGKLIREEMLAAMRGLDPTSTTYMMMKYAQNRIGIQDMFRDLDAKVLQLHCDRGWRTLDEDRGKDIRRSMVRLAVFESDNPKCRKCKGSGVGRNGGACRQCRGAGGMMIRDSDRAEALGVSRQSFNHTHKERYAAVLQMVLEIEPAAIRKIRKNLYEA